MFYKIVFDPELGAWLVKIQQFHLFWIPVCEGGRPRGFQAYGQATSWVQSAELDKVYRNYADAPPVGFTP